MENAAAYRPVIVAYRNGAPVRLEQLGRVIDSIENNKALAWFNGERGVMLAIQRQPGTNTVQVVDNIRKLLPTFRKEIPRRSICRWRSTPRRASAARSATCSSRWR